MNLVRSVGESGKVVSIEGSPNNFRVVKNNMLRNGVKNVEVHNVFVDSSHDAADFRPDDYDPYGAIARLDNQASGFDHITRSLVSVSRNYQTRSTFDRTVFSWISKVSKWM